MTGPLARIDPLALSLATLPAMVLLIFTRDVTTPAAFLAAGLLLAVVSGASWRRLAVVALAAAGLVTIVTAALLPWVDESRASRSAGEVALATGLRLAAILVLAWLPALAGHTGRGLVRSLVRNARLPYRWGYAGLAAGRLVPGARAELELARAVRRSRGAATSGRPWSPLRRLTEPVVPVLAGQIRRAERAALALESRGFGAYPRRTEPDDRPLGLGDLVFVALGWLVTVGLLILCRR
ncbi:energy-coupling factor transporter transmembrane component T family protein [Nocardioides sp.]|uniref:energy-coupling factor transporter transmembrane component T family protein n=1 Tax=Nocardioides sp. TaxID=35761 RepID=UPI0039E47BC1